MTDEAWPAIFQPLRFRNLEVKNRLFRSSISGRFDNYDGSGTQTRIDWDVKFARGGIGAIISSNTPVHPRGLIVPNYSHLDSDERVPFYSELGKRVRDAGAKYIVQLAFSGRQRDIPSVLYDKGLSSTDKPDPLHGFQCERMTKKQIDEIVDSFGQAARRAREAELDGIEVHGCNGYLITQFLSPAINDREDEYGGSLENRARFPLEVVRAIRKQIGDDFHLQFKISAVDDGKALFPWANEGTTLEESIQVCKWLDRGRRGRAPHLVRLRLPAPAEPGREVPDRGRHPLVRHHALERDEHLQELPHVPHAAHQQGVRVGVGAACPPARRRGHQPLAGPGDQARGRRARPLRGRLSDGLGDLASDRGRLGGRRDDGRAR